MGCNFVPYCPPNWSPKWTTPENYIGPRYFQAENHPRRKPNHKPINSGLFIAPSSGDFAVYGIGFPTMRWFVISFQFPSPHVPNSSAHLVKPNFRGQDEMKQVPLVNCRPCGDSWVEKKLGRLGPNGLFMDLNGMLMKFPSGLNGIFMINQEVLDGFWPPFVPPKKRSLNGFDGFRWHDMTLSVLRHTSSIPNGVVAEALAESRGKIPTACFVAYIFNPCSQFLWPRTHVEYLANKNLDF